MLMSTEIPEISVVMPSYNCELYIAEAIESVLNQTFKNFELIVVDNYSSDGTLETIKRFTDGRIHIEQCSNDGVIAKSRNIGIKIARGRYIAFLDADDFWHSKKLEECFRLFQTQIDLVYHAEHWINQNGGCKKVNYRSGKRCAYLQLLKLGNVLSTSSVVVRKSALDYVGGFCEKENYVTAEDYDLWMRLALNGYIFSYMTQPLGTYRIHSNNSIKQDELHERAMISVLSDHFDNSESYKFNVITRRRRLSLLYAESGFTKAQKGQVRLSVLDFIKALRQFPIGLRVLFLFFGSSYYYLRWDSRTL